jgi:hypothetical protein
MSNVQTNPIPYPIANATVPVQQEVSTQVETITPAKAENYLKLNQSNRHIRPALVDNYARDMTDNLWLSNGSTICFDTNGRLMDGQHRLSAIVKSGKSIDVLVIRNLDPEAQKTMDLGPGRISSDAFTFAGYKDATSMSLACKMGLNFANNNLLRTNSHASKYSNVQLLKFASENPGIIDSVKFVQEYRNVGTSRGTAAFAHWHLSKIDNEAADDMFSNIANFKTDGKGDPIHAFCIKMSRIKSTKKTRLTSTEELYMLFRVWTAIRKNETMINIKYSAATTFINPA